MLACCQGPACRPHTYCCSAEQVVVHKVELADPAEQLVELTGAVEQARMVAAAAEAVMRNVAYSAQGMNAGEAGQTESQRRAGQTAS